MNEIASGRHLVPRYDAKPTATNAALLIDFDNVTLGVRSDLQHQLRQLMNSEIIKGKVAVQRAYADWRRYPQYIAPLSEASIDLIFAPAFGSNKKNATDIRLAIDALELVFLRPEIGTFILLSGDSDFSSLVLKLKEYGKWVIGVGLRESASDLLMQNCDEYFSYNDLTGLSKEGDIEIVRRDPWELVVEAVLKMRETADVMRSDRLKQVMQQIDPHFDEAQLGFNRFSKFVTEAHRRELLDIKKLESGQYEVEIGSDANVLPEKEVPAEPSRRATEEGKVAQLTSVSKMTLAQGLDLLKKALVALDAIEDISVNSELVRDWMRDAADDSDDPLFESSSFGRLLRQAHDANLVDVAKDADDYHVRLRKPAEEEDDDEVEGKVPTPPKNEVAKTERLPEKKTKAVVKKTARTPRTPRASSGQSPDATSSRTAAAIETTDKTESQKTEDPKPRAKRTTTKRTTAKRETKAPATKAAEIPAKEDSGPVVRKESVIAPATPTTTAKTGRRGSVRGRGSSKTKKPQAKSALFASVDVGTEKQAVEKTPSPLLPKGSGPTSIRGRGSSKGKRAPIVVSGEVPAVTSGVAQNADADKPSGKVEVVAPPPSSSRSEKPKEEKTVEPSPKAVVPIVAPPEKTKDPVPKIEARPEPPTEADAGSGSKSEDSVVGEGDSPDDNVFLRMAKALQRSVKGDEDDA